MSDLEISPDMDPEEVLAHYGIKGMRWGKRKAESVDGSDGSDTSSRGLSDGQKKALKIGGGVLLAGAVVAGVVLAKKGNIPIGSLRAPLPKTAVMRDKADQAARQKLLASMTSKASSVKDTASTVKSAAETVAQGKEAIDNIRSSEAWQKKVSDFQSQINDAQREQTRYMIDDSADSGIPYNARNDNPYSNEARRR